MKIASRLSNRKVRIVLGGLSLLVIFLAWWLFYSPSTSNQSAERYPSLKSDRPPDSGLEAKDADDPMNLLVSVPTADGGGNLTLSASQKAQSKFTKALQILSDFEEFKSRVVRFDDEEQSYLSEFLDDLLMVQKFLTEFPKETDARLYLAQMDQAINLLTELYKEALDKSEIEALSQIREVADALTQDSVFTDLNLSSEERQIRAGMLAQLGYQISAVDPSWLSQMSSRLNSPEGRKVIDNIRALQEENLLESSQ